MCHVCVCVMVSGVLDIRCVCILYASEMESGTLARLYMHTKVSHNCK